MRCNRLRAGIPGPRLAEEGRESSLFTCSTLPERLYFEVSCHRTKDAKHRFGLYVRSRWISYLYPSREMEKTRQPTHLSPRA